MSLLFTFEISSGSPFTPGKLAYLKYVSSDSYLNGLKKRSFSNIGIILQIAKGSIRCYDQKKFDGNGDR